MVLRVFELKNITYYYANNLALNNINLSIKKGEAIALMGANGSGKSTILKLINGLVFQSSGCGEFLYKNQLITEKKLEDSAFSKLFHKNIGFIFQNTEAQLFCTSVYDEIAFGLIQMGLSEEDIDVRVKDCLRLLDIEKLSDRQPYNLSGGEKKKVAIAAVLALNPEVIVLDEPMNSLDAKTKRFLRQLLIDLNSCGKTLICSTHDFEYVEGVFKRAIVFGENHEIIRDDDYEKVMKDNEFLVENNIK